VIGLLQRLAGQALSVNAGDESPAAIRPAASTHAQMPAAMSFEFESAVPTSRPKGAAEADESARARPSPARAREDAHGSAQTRAIDRNDQPSAFVALPEARSDGTAPRDSSPLPLRPHQTPSWLERTTPQPLLGDLQLAQVPIPSIVPATPGRLRFEAARSSATAEPVEVHVHIGRIDVSAMHEPVAPKQHAVKQRSTLTLGEYLARRRRS
jgi:hypothetical protein